VFGSQWERAGNGSYVGHYDGRSWREVATPGVVAAAAAPAPDAVWVIGPTDKTAGRALARQALIAMHWTGRRWVTVAAPRVRLAGPGSSLQAAYVVATGPRTLWWSYVVTSTSARASNATGLLELNDGRWTAVPLPAPIEYIDAMTEDGEGGLWLLADVETDYALDQYWYHYADGGWTRQLVPSPRLYNTTMFGMAWVPGTTQAWAAGEADRNGSKGGPATEGVLAFLGA
jgi:hypothetical protein